MFTTFSIAYRYRYKTSLGVRLTHKRAFPKYSIMNWKVVSCSSFHSYSLFYLKIKKGKHLSMHLDINHLTCFILQFGYYISFIFLGDFMSIKAFILSQFASIPLIDTKYPITFSEVRLKNTSWDLTSSYIALILQKYFPTRLHAHLVIMIWSSRCPHKFLCFTSVDF